MLHHCYDHLVWVCDRAMFGTPAMWSVCALRSSELFEPQDVSFDDISRGKVQQEPDAHVDDDQIIKLADHRNEIGNQIDRHRQVKDEAWGDQADP